MVSNIVSKKSTLPTKKYKNKIELLFTINYLNNLYQSHLI